MNITPTFSLSISAAPSTQSHASAQHFVEAIYRKGYCCSQVFFYADAVYIASRFSNPPSDELDLRNQWAKLSKQYQFPLRVCVAAASQRGILCAEEAAKLELAPNLAEQFEISGVGSFVEAMLSGTRHIAFKD